MMMQIINNLKSRNFRLLVHGIILHFHSDFVLWQISNIPSRQHLVFKSIPMSSLQWDSNVVLTFSVEIDAPEAFQHLCAQLVPTCCSHLAEEKSRLQKDIVIGLVCSLKSYLEFQLQAACWTKIFRHNQPQDFNQTRVFHKEMIHHLSKENETPVPKSDLSQ